jgi:AmmeMemoRadiSam system protein A
MLDDSDKASLLNLARKTLEDHFNQDSIPDFQTDCPELLEPKGAFVTLNKEGDLRGCIGQLDPDRELFRVVQHCSLSAAFGDPRFPPVQPEELDGLNIEISVLTPFRRVENIEEISVGRHGLYIVQGHFRGLLLPQVAREYGWDRETFLQQTCYKAGLNESAWKDPRTILYIFEAEVFSESGNSA